MKQGPNSQQAIANLNYIARFNGSSYRIPEDTHFQLSSKYANLDAHEEADHQKVNQLDDFKRSRDKSLTKAFEEVKLLFTEKDLYSLHSKLLIMFICIHNLYLISIFNSQKIHGNSFTISNIVGFCEILGMVISDRVLKYIPDHISMYISMVGILVTSNLLLLFDLDQAVTYLLIFLQVISVGMSFNSIFLLIETRTDPKVFQVSFEICYSLSAAFSLLTPMIPMLSAPLTLGLYYFLCLCSIFVMI